MNNVWLGMSTFHMKSEFKAQHLAAGLTSTIWAPQYLESFCLCH